MIKRWKLSRTTYGFGGIFQHKFIATEDGSHNDEQLQTREVTSDAAPVERQVSATFNKIVSLEGSYLGPNENGLNVF